jgi:putative peptidoglycan lipid II flippase
MTAASEGTGKGLSGRQIAQAAVIVMAGFVLSRLTGLIRETVIATIFGGGIAYDSFVAASRPPETLFLVVAGGAIGSAFIPTFADYIAQGRRDEAYRLTSTVANLIFLLMAALAGLSALFARPIVNTLLVPEFDPQAQALTAHMLRIMLVTPVIYSVSGLMMGFLNAHQRFLLPALAPLLRNLGIIFGAVILSPSMGVYGLAWGTVIGAALHFLIQLPGVLAIHFPYRLQLDIRHPGVLEVGRLMGPRVLGLAIVQINFWINTVLASGMVGGSIGALSRAWYIMLLPQGVIAQSVATAVFPTFAAQVSEGRREALQQTLGQVLRAVLFLALPATVGLVMLRQPVVRLIYEYGAFTPEDSAATAWALLFYALGLVAHSVVEIVTRAFYAMHDTRTPVLIGGGAMLLNVGLSLLLIQMIGTPGSLTHGPFAGLALANTLATTLEGLALLLLIRPRVGGLDEPRLAASLARAGAACLGMGVVIWALGGLLIDRAGVIVGTLGAIAAGGAAFWGLAWLLGSEEARGFTGLVLGRIGLGRA